MVSRLGSGGLTSSTAVKAGVDPCKRCLRKSTVQSVVVSRGEAFCGPCFNRFLTTKFRKQLGDDSYKPLYLKDKTPVETTAHVLVPVLVSAADTNGGICRIEAAVALIDILAELIRSQRAAHRGRQGLYLHVFEITKSDQDESTGSAVQTMLETKYTENEITEYKTSSIDSFFKQQTDNSSFWNTLQIDQYTHTAADSLPPPKTLDDLLAILPSKTSRADILTIMIDHLIRKTAHDFGCQSVFQPHTLTYLAERAMASVCKGRGIELGTSLNPIDTGKLANSNDTNGPLVEISPLADLYDTEIKSYMQLHDLQLPSVIADMTSSTSNTATKAMSMDQLLHNYFSDIDAAFPSVTTTIVRTIDKLATPFEVPDHPAYSSPTDAKELCKICGARRQEDALSWLHKISVMKLSNTDLPKNNNAPSSTLADQEQVEEYEGPSGLCYGCVVAFRNSAQPNIMWPRNTTEQVLSEFEL